MKDIRSLFEAARTSGNDSDILSYTEAIQECFNTPTDYISNLEYIISSSIGAGTFKEFTNKFGITIPCYEYVSSILEKCTSRLNKSGINSKEYNSLNESLKAFHDKYEKCFSMFEFYAGDDVQDYTRTYYSFNENGIQNRLLLSGMFKHFGEASIADAIITADRINAVDSVLKFVAEHGDATLCEWVTKCTEGMKCNEALRESVNQKSLSYIIGRMNERHTQQLRESAIYQQKDAEYDYTESEIQAIKDMIAFKEFAMCDDVKEFAEINKLYDELDGIMFESDDELEEKEKEEYVPVFGVVKSYSADKFKNDGTPKDKGDMVSTHLKKVMNKLTRGDVYSHAVLSFDPDMKEMFSYEAPGFVKDSFDKDIWITTDHVYVCVMFVKKSEKEKMLKYIKHLESHPEESKFDYMNMLRSQIGKPGKVNNRFVCAEFVAYVLGMCDPKNLHRDYSRFRPEDFTILPRAFYVMNFKDRTEFNAKKGEFKRRVDEIYRNHKDEIEDYNNMLPKILLKDRMDKLKTIDKIVDWIVTKGPKEEKESSINESADMEDD